MMRFENSEPEVKEEKGEQSEREIPPQREHWLFNKYNALMAYGAFIGIVATHDWSAKDKHPQNAITTSEATPASEFASVDTKTPEDKIIRDLFEKTYGPEEMKEYDHLRKILREYVGETALRDIENGDFLAIMEKRDRMEKNIPVYEYKSPEIIDFEQANIDVDTLKKVWTEGTFYPKGWINGEVSKIQYFDREEDMAVAVYGEKFKKSKAAAGYSAKGISFYAPEKPVDKKDKEARARLSETFDFYMGHELGHGKDWKNARDLTLVQRAKLLENVIFFGSWFKRD